MVSATYSYDGDGRRVKKVNGFTTIFVYDAMDRLVAEYSDQSNTAGTNYLTSDTLGSPRIVTDSIGTVKGRHDYLPFGEDIATAVGNRSTVQGYSSLDYVRQKFTQKERDSETGLDYFLARYYSSAQGRFTSPDSFSGNRYDPQTLNRYAYVSNNPVRFIDTTGHSIEGWLHKTENKKKSKWQDEILFNRGGMYPGFRQDQNQSPTPPPGTHFNGEGALVNDDGTPYLPPENAGDVSSVVVNISDPPPPSQHKSWFKTLLGWLGFGGGAAAATTTASSGGTIFSGSVRFISGVAIYDQRGNLIYNGTIDLQPTYERISRGELNPHRNDGSTFENREQILPVQPSGYYTEWVVPTPGVSGPGSQRIITGQNGEIWYTADHYNSFMPLNDIARKCGCGPGPN